MEALFRIMPIKDIYLLRILKLKGISMVSSSSEFNHYFKITPYGSSQQILIRTIDLKKAGFIDACSKRENLVYLISIVLNIDNSINIFP